MPRRIMEGWTELVLGCGCAWYLSYIEAVIFSTKAIEEQMSVDLGVVSLVY